MVWRGRASTTDACVWLPGNRPGSLSTDGGERATACSLLMGEEGAPRAPGATDPWNGPLVSHPWWELCTA